jgi:hypothetical protein
MCKQLPKVPGNVRFGMLEERLNTSFVPDEKAKRSWQWDDGMEVLNSRLYQWPEPGGSDTGDLREEGTGAAKESTLSLCLPLIASADAPTHSPLQALAESNPLLSSTNAIPGKISSKVKIDAGEFLHAMGLDTNLMR